MKLWRHGVIGALGLLALAAQAAEVVNVYSQRQSYPIDPIFKAFSQQTGIQVNSVYLEDGLAERLAREGELTPADLVLTVDISRLMELVERDLAQPVASEVIRQNIPAQYRAPDDSWFALTTRVRNIYSSRERLGAMSTLRYEDLADSRFKGKICTRSGKHQYNVALVASMLAHHGEAETRQWLQGVKANLARKPQGNDRDRVKAIKEGICDLSLGNSYYYGVMLNTPAQKPWAEAVYINFPNQEDRGAHVNVSGMVMTKHAKHPAAARQLMEFLSGDAAQQLYAELNMEYPVKPGVALSPLVASWGTFKPDSLAIAEIAKQRKAALRLLDEVRFDL